MGRREGCPSTRGAPFGQLRQTLGLALTGTVLALGNAAYAGCTASAQADAKTVRTAAKNTAEEGKAQVSGGRAQVTGTISLHGEERLSSKVMGQTFRGGAPRPRRLHLAGHGLRAELGNRTRAGPRPPPCLR
ncbi:hypothetical protein [Deinococcus hopiensis]|uniref:Lipoprotein n=1 Tax=Deinococcus hopiensis KR-140 TaxID=695939 RepID=A0A1W1VDP9_9DEIO|nr:hypothetical protein [Deinococcus hopiensis]SMB91529.1 hypothetical protein SAMN00790413_01172 [Deinococcus hopiensis KR-140]